MGPVVQQLDAVAFDTRPASGGKVVIQAKRYGNTVGISAVSDMYSTIRNEGADRGIPTICRVAAVFLQHASGRRAKNTRALRTGLVLGAVRETALGDRELGIRAHIGVLIADHNVVG
jgi:hypothetical protein